MGLIDEQGGQILEKDFLGAFCRENHIAVPGAAAGPLSGLTFAVKDVFHIKGGITGFGHPDWLNTHGVETATAAAVQRLLDAGATMVGKTITDELAYSLSGQNYHYGTPINPSDPARIPGGSSSGSASAVAGGLVDFSLGSDCGGSVRIPASYCGIFGMRPTHGRISLEGALPFAPSFDCAGWFARDIDLFGRVGRILLGESKTGPDISTVLLPLDALDVVDPEVQMALLPAIAKVEAILGPAKTINLTETGLDSWSETFRTLQAAEIWQSLGGWIEEVQPVFGPGIRDRFSSAAAIDLATFHAARKHRISIQATLARCLPPGTAMLMPTAPRAAPRLNSNNEELETSYRHQAMNLLCVAGLGGLPQISLPMCKVEGMPIGLSLVAARGADFELLDIATTVIRDKAER